MKQYLATAMSFALIAGPALAQAAPATLASLGGDVMVSHGAGFVHATSKMALRPGDKVVSMKGGSARLVYANGCSVVLTGGSTATVAKSAPCAPGASLASRDTDRTADQGGEDAAPFFGLGSGALVAGAAIVGIIAAVAVTASTNNTSP